MWDQVEKKVKQTFCRDCGSTVAHRDYAWIAVDVLAAGFDIARYSKLYGSRCSSLKPPKRLLDVQKVL